MDDLPERLECLYVWPQSIADNHADILTPRQIEKLYEVGNVAERAAAEIRALRAKLAEAEGEQLIRTTVELLRAQRSYSISGSTMYEWINPDGPPAANLIEAQASEIRDLRAQVAVALDTIADYIHIMHTLMFPTKDIPQ